MANFLEAEGGVISVGLSIMQPFTTERMLEDYATEINDSKKFNRHFQFFPQKQRKINLNSW